MARKSDNLPPMYGTMNLFTAESPQDGRYSITISRRLSAVVLVPFDGYVVVGFFWNDQLFYLMDHPLGEA
jgi:hypothetical protein